MNLKQAHNQWANRPEDERFSNISEFKEAVEKQRSKSKEFSARLKDLKVCSEDEDNLYIQTPDGDYVPNNWSFTQLSRNADFPSNALTRDRLNAPLVADILNHRIKRITEKEPDREVNIYVEEKDDGRLLRSINSERYGRIYNTFVAAGIENLINNGWRVPPARPVIAGQKGTRKATEADVINAGQSNMGLQVKVGDDIAPAGLYAGDRDMFALLCHPDRSTDDGTGRKLFEAIVIWNSEVGACTFGIQKMKLAAICGNHILWDVQEVLTYKTKHIGEADKRAKYLFIDLQEALSQYNPSDEQKIYNKLRSYEIAANQEDVVDTVYDMNISPVLTKKILNSAYEMGEIYGDTDGAKSNTPLGMVHGMTRFSQTLGNANDRWNVDKAAGLIAKKFQKVLA